MYQVCTPLINPFRTAVPFWGQTTWILNGLSPKRDCGSKRVKSASSYYQPWPYLQLEEEGAGGVVNEPGHEADDQGSLGHHHSAPDDQHQRIHDTTYNK